MKGGAWMKSRETDGVCTLTRQHPKDRLTSKNDIGNIKCVLKGKCNDAKVGSSGETQGV